MGLRRPYDFEIGLLKVRWAIFRANSIIIGIFLPLSPIGVGLQVASYLLLHESVRSILLISKSIQSLVDLINGLGRRLWLFANRRTFVD